MTLSFASIAAYVLLAAAAAARSGAFSLRDPLTVAFALVLLCYFMPLVFLYGKPYSLLIWAGAHALQYYVMILASLSLRDRTQLNVASGLGVGAITLAAVISLTLVAYVSGEASRVNLWANPVARVIAGLVAGVNLVHFWVDAFIWKFSRKDIRQLHGEAFRF